MIFGHATTSHGLSFENNVFVFAGCVQIRNDRAGVAVMCPNGNRPDGQIINNTFVTCEGVPGIWANPKVKGCADNLTVSGNTMTAVDTVVAQPQVSFTPPAPTNTAPIVQVSVMAATDTPNATLRYTLDGSRPTKASPILPPDGVSLTWPGPNLAFNVIGFHPTMQPSVTNGVVIERALYAPRADAIKGGLRSSMDPFKVENGTLVAAGWAVDASLERAGWYVSWLSFHTRNRIPLLPRPAARSDAHASVSLTVARDPRCRPGHPWRSP